MSGIHSGDIAALSNAVSSAGKKADAIVVALNQINSTLTKILQMLENMSGGSDVRPVR